MMKQDVFRFRNRDRGRSSSCIYRCHRQRGGWAEIYVSESMYCFGRWREIQKSAQNPVVTGDMLPKGFSREHFRDPKIWKEDDGYYMVVGNKTDGGKPQVVLFHSENTVEWEYVSVLAEDKDGNLGTMWECPDFFELDGEYILLASPQDLCAGPEFHNGNNAVYYTGSYDRGRHAFDYTHVYSLDDGLDFYASQTMLSADGRRILIGWMQTWDANIRPADQKWACMMTIPRELRIENGRILQSPVRELENTTVPRFIMISVQ